MSLFLFFSAVFLEFLLLGIFVNNNFNFLSSNAFYNNTKFLYEAHSNFVYKKHQNFLQSNYSNVFNTFFPFNSFYILKIFIDFTNYVNLVFDETSLPNKESFYSNLNMENIDDIDYRHGNNVFKIFKLKNLREYHDLYVQSDTLLLADVFENFRNTSIKVYELDPAHFLSLPGLAWQACLKKTNIKLLIVEEGIRFSH